MENIKTDRGENVLNSLLIEFGPLRCEGQCQIKCVPHKEKDKSFDKPSSKHVPSSKCTQMVLKSSKEHFYITV